VGPNLIKDGSTRVGKTQSMHWVVGFNAKNLIYANKTMVFFVDVFQLTIIIKGGRIPQFFSGLMHWIFF
jgi:hypothetical protein